MPSLHYPAIDTDDPVVKLVCHETAPLRWLNVYRLRLGGSLCEYEFETGDREWVLDILGGRCTVNIKAGAQSATFPDIGGRSNVFEGKPTMVYMPRDAAISIYAETDNFDGLLVSAPADNPHPPSLICTDEAHTRSVGKDNWRRTVHTSVGEHIKADRLIVGETFNPPGNWSSSPPHKHDSYDELAGDSSEIPMEEVYFYLTDPPQGFGLQHVYTSPDDAEPLNETYAVHSGDVVVLPKGYHPVVAAPGYQLFYFWALAGEERKYGAWSDDPAHSWIKDSQ